MIPHLLSLRDSPNGVTISIFDGWDWNHPLQWYIVVCHPILQSGLRPEKLERRIFFLKADVEDMHHMAMDHMKYASISPWLNTYKIGHKWHSKRAEQKGSTSPVPVRSPRVSKSAAAPAQAKRRQRSAGEHRCGMLRPSVVSCQHQGALNFWRTWWPLNWWWWAL